MDDRRDDPGRRWPSSYVRPVDAVRPAQRVVRKIAAISAALAVVMVAGAIAAGMHPGEILIIALIPCLWTVAAWILARRADAAASAEAERQPAPDHPRRSG